MTSPHGIVLRPAPWWWPKVALKLRRCRQRILVVTDSLSFDPADGFGLTEFLAELAAAVPQPVVTTARRGGPQPFVFDATVTTARYDQIWLFGASGPALTRDEIAVLWNFMEAGGGLFATGDHETLGFPLCGELPRVRKMRDWRNTPMVNERIDTITNPGDGVARFDDQSDEYPQRIFPHYSGSGSQWYPHPLLRSPAGDIDVLPDHAHESVCGVGYDLADRYSLHGMDLEEFPSTAQGPLAPEVVASSVSAGRYLTDLHKPPTTPRLFGAISVWDGYRVGRGRIVTDATWHHFLNINLNGVGSGRPGLAAQARAQIGEYYRNIADWLTPAGRRWCLWWVHLLVERYRYPLFEEWEPLNAKDSWPLRVALGRRIEAALDGHYGRGYTAELVTTALPADAGGWITDVVRPQPGEGRDSTLIDADELRVGVLAGIVDALVHRLPPSPEDLDDALDDHDDDHHDAQIVELVATAMKESAVLARDHFARRARHALELLGRG